MADMKKLSLSKCIHAANQRNMEGESLSHSLLVLCSIQHLGPSGNQTKIPVLLQLTLEQREMDGNEHP